MKVAVFPCRPAANESELKAIEHLKSRLQSEPGDGEWVLLTNLAFSDTHQLQSDEIDVVAARAGIPIMIQCCLRSGPHLAHERLSF